MFNRRLKWAMLTIVGSAIFIGLDDIDGFAEPIKPAPAHFPVIQIIQDQLVLDNATVKNASIIIKEDQTYGGLNVELKPEAEKILTEITTAGEGRRLELVFNNVMVISTVIQTPLKGNFLISGISREDAQAFLNVLNANKPKPKEEE